MKAFSVNHYKIYDYQFTNWKTDVQDKWVYDDFIKDPDYKKGWISLTSLAYHKPSDAVYLGLGSFSAELLWKFDRATKQITSCGYEKFGEPFDAKFHRSLEIDGDNLYGGIAFFHDIDKQFEAKGGRIIKYDIQTGQFSFLARPFEPAYIQSIALDAKRQVIYCFCASPEVFVSYDIRTGKSKLIAHIGSACEFCQAHNPVIDRDGNVWGTYGIIRAFSYGSGPDSLRLFKYSPAEDKMYFLKKGFPRTGTPGDKGKVDTFLLGPDGMIYVGTVFGILARLNPSTGEIETLCKPHTGTRLAGLAFSPLDGLLYGICGEHYDVKLFAYDTAKNELVGIQDIKDSKEGIRPDRIHHMLFTDDGTIYAGENDNNDRSSYLWEIKFEC